MGAATSGNDAGKKVNGRKRHLVVDTTGKPRKPKLTRLSSAAKAPTSRAQDFVAHLVDLDRRAADAEDAQSADERG